MFSDQYVCSIGSLTALLVFIAFLCNSKNIQVDNCGIQRGHHLASYIFRNACTRWKFVCGRRVITVLVCIMLLFSEHQHIVDINVILDNLKACHKVLARITSTNEKMYIKRIARMRTTRHGFGMYCL